MQCYVKNALQKFAKYTIAYKHKVNRWVLSLRLHETKLSASRTAAGKPTVPHDWAGHRERSVAKFVHGTVQLMLDAERRRAKKYSWRYVQESIANAKVGLK